MYRFAELGSKSFFACERYFKRSTIKPGPRLHKQIHREKYDQGWLSSEQP